MPKKKKKEEIDKFIKSVIARAESFIDKLGIRDLIYTLAYFSAVYTAYVTWLKAKALLDLIPTPSRFFQLIGGGVVIPIFFGEEIKDRSDPLVEKLDPEGLALSFIAAYMVLKIDADDVKSAITSITGIVTKLK